MNTQPTNEYLNRERLSDLAQFAVPDGHDLWPRIKQAARASASGITTPRPGILSLGLSRAWTAVGVLFIAATFAALGFGLAVLVLSNGHDQVPAAQLEATVTPAPISPTPSPTPTVQPAGANTPPLYVPDYPRDLDHIRESLGSVFVPTYVPDGYRLVEASVNADPLLPFEASLVYRNGRRGFGGEAVGEFFIYQFPEGWDADTHEPNYEERTIEGLTVRHPWDVRDRAAFYFQAGGHWHYISVFGESPENADINELVRVAQSVQGFSADDIVDWLVVSGITRRGFGNNVLSDLDDFIEGRTDSIYISGYLPNNLGLESIWISPDSDSVTLEFVLPSHLRDGKRLERVTLTTRSNPTLYSEQVDVGGSTGYVFWGTTSSDVTLVFQYEGRWFELEGSPARDKSALDELLNMALSLELYGEPEQHAPTSTVNSETLRFRSADPPPIHADTPTAPESWVSENGFIQFTTGALEDLFDEPLPGTHPQCIPPTTPPEQPGPWLVPTKLPDGMEQEVRDQMFPGTMYRAFRRPMDHVSMEQGLCAIRQLNPAMYRAVQIGDRTAYVTARGKLSADGSSRVFDLNAASTLIMDVGYGVVSFNVFGSVTVDDLVAMAASLVPEELTEAEQGPYPQAVLDALGTGFGPVYVPGKLPDGYEMFGQMQARQEALEPRTTRLSYVRTSDNFCVFRLNQAGLRSQFPDVVQKAQRGDETTYTTTDESGQSIRATAKWGTVEIDGVTIYAQEFSAQPRNEYTDVYFQSHRVWFNLAISTSSYCEHSLEMVAEIAASLEPLQPYTKPTAQEADTGTPLIAFHSNRDGNWNIYVMNADGTGQTRLTDNPAADSWPSWSPDGRRIAFISSRDDPDPDDDESVWEIYLMNADGSDQTRLTFDSAWHSLPRWSPDGRRIAFQSYTDENWEIHVMNADSSDQRRLTANSVWDGIPSWSPDSQRIAFHTTIDENAEIYVMNADGSDQANLTNDAANDWSPSWSPDGRRIAFHSHRDGNSEIYIMNADGSDQTRLTNNPARDVRPVWSSDGRSIAFTSNRDDPDPIDDDDIRNIYVMNPDGSGLTRLTNESSINYASSWSTN